MDLQRGHFRRNHSTLGSQTGQVIASMLIGKFLSGKQWR
jgi:hypothetical protein